MAHALRNDARRRAVVAIDEDRSGQPAVARLGTASSAIKWTQLLCRTGRASAGRKDE